MIYALSEISFQTVEESILFIKLRLILLANWAIGRKTIMSPDPRYPAIHALPPRYALACVLLEICLGVNVSRPRLYLGTMTTEVVLPQQTTYRRGPTGSVHRLAHDKP